MAKLNLEHFPVSESAKKMLGYVSDGFYDNSYIGKWLFEVMGQEYDMVLDAVEELPAQFFPETATWGLMYHEIKWGLPVRTYLSYEERRKLICQKRDFRSPMTPYRMERYLQDATGFEVYVSDVNDAGKYGFVPPHPNVFKVHFVSEKTLDSKLVHKLLNRLKQSHTTYTVNDRMEIELDNHNLEHIALRNIKFKISALFWYNKYIYNGACLFDGTWQLDGTWQFEGACLFDGTWQLDGAWQFDSTVSYNTKRRYALVLGLEHIFCFCTFDRISLISLRFSGWVKYDEIFNVKVRDCFGINFWSTLYFDGSWNFDGSVILDEKHRYGIALNAGNRIAIENRTGNVNLPALSIGWKQYIQERISGRAVFSFSVDFGRIMYLDGEWMLDGEQLLNFNRCRVKTALAVCVVLDLSEQETLINVTVETKTKDYWFLDGGLLMDGSRMFNSIYRKEMVK